MSVAERTNCFRIKEKNYYFKNVFIFLFWVFRHWPNRVDGGGILKRYRVYRFNLTGLYLEVFFKNCLFSNAACVLIRTTHDPYRRAK